MDIVSKVKNLIQWGRITRTETDSGNIQRAQVESVGKPLPYVVVYPYGISAQAPVASRVLKFLIGGSAQSPAGIPTNPENRFQGLKEWEVAVGNFLKKNRIFFDENGGITIEVLEAGQTVTIQNELGFVRLESDGQVNLNDNFTVDV